MGMMTGGYLQGKDGERGVNTDTKLSNFVTNFPTEPIQNIVILPKIFPDKYLYITLYNI